MSSNEGRRLRRTEAQWREIVAAQEASGLSQAAFCRQRGLAVSTFQYQRRRLRATRQARGDAEGPAVIDLGELAGQPSGGWEVEIALGDGVSLTLRRH